MEKVMTGLTVAAGLRGRRCEGGLLPLCGQVHFQSQPSVLLSIFQLPVDLQLCGASVTEAGPCLSLHHLDWVTLWLRPHGTRRLPRLQLECTMGAFLVNNPMPSSHFFSMSLESKS
uniref:Uncharacterized protein n=1 Tax=Knipowitschia caucasica TaxID=637954 RepID=A0AAV2LSZ3_KNICA